MIRAFFTLDYPNGWEEERCLSRFEAKIERLRGRGWFSQLANEAYRYGTSTTVCGMGYAFRMTWTEDEHEHETE